jgi:NADH-quinone oxidoreductase subunit M
LLAGVFPGAALGWIAEVQRLVGLPVVPFTLGGVEDARGGLDMIWIAGILFAGFGVGALVFYGLGGKSKTVHQLDNYAGGHFLTADVRYQYSDNFYAGLMHLIGPWYRGGFLWLEGAVAGGVDFLSFSLNGLYRLAQPALLALAVAVAALAWASV